MARGGASLPGGAGVDAGTSARGDSTALCFIGLAARLDEAEEEGLDAIEPLLELTKSRLETWRRGVGGGDELLLSLPRVVSEMGVWGFDEIKFLVDLGS
jgi:hypothetical protein